MNYTGKKFRNNLGTYIILDHFTNESYGIADVGAEVLKLWNIGKKRMGNPKYPLIRVLKGVEEGTYIWVEPMEPMKRLKKHRLGYDKEI